MPVTARTRRTGRTGRPTTGRTGRPTTSRTARPATGRAPGPQRPATGRAVNPFAAPGQGSRTHGRAARRGPGGKAGGILGMISCGAFGLGIASVLLSVMNAVNQAQNHAVTVGTVAAVGFAVLFMWLCFLVGAVLAAVEVATATRERVWSIVGLVLNGGALAWLLLTLAMHARGH